MRSRVSIGDWPRLSRFYGIPPSELAKMPHVLLAIYAEELLVLSAEEALQGFLTADFPYMEKGDRSKAHRAWSRYLPESEPEPVDVRTATGASVIAGMGIGIDIPITEVESPVET